MYSEKFLLGKYFFLNQIMSLFGAHQVRIEVKMLVSYIIIIRL